MLATEMLPKNIRFRELFSLRIFRQGRVGGNPTSDATGAAVPASKVSAAAYSDPFLHFCAGSVRVFWMSAMYWRLLVIVANACSE
jgi:hypothetical protein